jgi:hypothetical protein
VDVSVLFDLGASREPTDIARDKDQMLGEAVWSEHLHRVARKTGGQARRRARPGPARR